MEFIRNRICLQNHHKGCAITIGNFDGVHLGHQDMLFYLAKQAAKRNLATMLLIFEPQPKEFFYGRDAPKRLTSLREKLYYLHKLPLDYVLCLYFNKLMATMTADRFIDEILHEKLNINYLLVGEDFRFGKDREGCLHKLQQAGKHYGFEVEVMKKISNEDRRISSTWIRDLLQQGNLDLAAKLLGHPYAMCGRVIHGDKRGRVMGFPTANVHRNHRIAPMTGIFIVEVAGINHTLHHGVASLGVRPMFQRDDHLLEVHLLDFNESIYGKYIQVHFLAKLRDEMNFASLTALQKQIKRDIEEAREFFTFFLDVTPKTKG